MDTIKRIVSRDSLPKTSQSSHPNPKIPRKKLASQSDQWTTITEQYSTQETQQSLLAIIQSDNAMYLRRTMRSTDANKYAAEMKEEFEDSISEATRSEATRSEATRSEAKESIRKERVGKPGCSRQEPDAANILMTHLKAKQSGYRSQDTIKKFYEPDRFIQIPDLINLLVTSNLSCFYCQKWTTLFYENVRDPRQWSLERLSNAEGHNRDNVVIACLECNMRRRTMYYERYLVTKQLKVTKLGSET